MKIKSRASEYTSLRIFLRLPVHGFIDDVAVGGIFVCECVGAILHAEHHTGFCAVVAHTAATVGSHADYRAFLNGKDLAINLEFSFSCEEEIELLVILVGVEEAGFLTGCEYLNGELTASSTDSLTAEHFAGDLDFRTEFENIILHIGKFAKFAALKFAPFSIV